MPVNSAYVGSSEHHAGSFVLQGSAAAIYVGREVDAGTGVFVLAGNAAGLIYSSDAGVFVPRVVWFY